MVKACGWGLLIAWAILTAVRVPTWQSDRTLWQDAAARAPHKPRALLNWAGAEATDGHLVRAWHLYDTARVEALRRPDAYDRAFMTAATLTNQAGLLRATGNAQQAGILLAVVLSRYPAFVPAQVLQAQCLHDLAALSS